MRIDPSSVSSPCMAAELLREAAFEAHALIRDRAPAVTGLRPGFAPLPPGSARARILLAGLHEQREPWLGCDRAPDGAALLGDSALDVGISGAHAAMLVIRRGRMLAVFRADDGGDWGEAGSTGIAQITCLDPDLVPGPDDRPDWTPSAHERMARLASPRLGPCNALVLAARGVLDGPLVALAAWAGALIGDVQLAACADVPDLRRAGARARLRLADLRAAAGRRDPGAADATALIEGVLAVL